MTEPFFDHERLDVYRLAKSLNGAERHARDQWLRAAQSIPLNIAEGNGKQSLNTRIIRSDRSIEYEYEYEYRDAEYEYEKTHEQSIGPKCSIGAL